MNKPTPRFTIDKDQLQQRQDLARKVYDASICINELDDGHAAILTFDFSQVADAFIACHEKLQAGWTVPEKMGASFVSVAPGVMGVSLGGFTVIHLVKPETVREAEIKAILQEVKTDYQAELDMEREVEINRVTEQKLALARRQRAQEQQEAEQAERDAVYAEVSAALAGGKQ